MGLHPRSQGSGLGGAGDSGGALGSFYTHNIERSLRFDDATNNYLTRTSTSVGNRKTFTYSSWVKRGKISADNPTWGITAGTLNNSSNDRTEMRFNSSDQVGIGFNTGSWYESYTNAKFRDTSAWYHFVVAVDMTQSTASDRLKFYVNGVSQTFSAYSVPNQNTDLPINTTLQHAIGEYVAGESSASYQFDGYLAEINFIDGTALTAASFGETKDGIWIPKDTSGLTFGTNGFRLEFKQTGTGTASTSTIGADTSGQTNHLTSTNLAANDVVPDTPTKNWATMNSLFDGNSAVLKQGNLEVEPGGFSSSKYGCISTISIPKDKKIYIEVVCTDQDGAYWTAGFVTQTSINAGPGSSNIGSSGAVMCYNRSVDVNDTETDYGSSAGLGGLGVAKLAAGDTLGLAIDGATGKVWFSRNGTFFKSPSTNNSGTTGNPSAGTNEIGTLTGGTTDEVFFVISGDANANDVFVNFGQESTFAGSKSAGSETDANGDGLFQYAVPTDYVCLHTGNMSDPTIGPTATTNADDHFNTVIWTGNNSAPRSITGVGFQPDWVWAKDRVASNNHVLVDAARGTGILQYSNTTVADVTGAAQINAFGADGFTIGATTYMNENGSSNKYVAWCWKGANGNTTNDASATSVGSIDSVHNANTTAGVSIVTYTGTGTAGTIAHGMGKVPSFYVVKNRTDASTSWQSYHIGVASDPETDYLYLNSDAVVDDSDDWNDTAPTSTVFSVKTHNQVNASGDTYLAYLFAPVEGFSALGSFKGNGSANGPFVYTGFRPAWVLIKQTSSAGNWNIMDNTRQTFNDADGGPVLRADISNAEEETDTMQGQIDILSNGFKLRANNSSYNTNGATVVYIAFAEAPFKFSNAR